MRNFARRVRNRLTATGTRYPHIVSLTDFDDRGVYFEITNRVERHRVVNHGDETEYTATMLNLLRSDDVVYDIGACVGLVALHAARRVKEVIAFEPDPAFSARLRRNLALNGDLEVQIVDVAISDRDGPVTLFTDGVAGTSPSLRRQRGERDQVTVQGRSLDSILEEGTLPVPDVVKLDIEGAEALAMRGATRLLREATPRLLYLELHPAFVPAFGASSDELLRGVADAGYTAVYERARADQAHYIFQASC